MLRRSVEDKDSEILKIADELLSMAMSLLREAMILDQSVKKEVVQLRIRKLAVKTAQQEYPFCSGLEKTLEQFSFDEIAA